MLIKETENYQVFYGKNNPVKLALLFVFFTRLVKCESFMVVKNVKNDEVVIFLNDKVVKYLTL